MDGERVTQVRTEDHEDPLGDVDDVHHSEDEGKTRRHQGVDRTGQDAVDDRMQDRSAVQGLVLPGGLGKEDLRRTRVRRGVDFDELRALPLERVRRGCCSLQAVELHRTENALDRDTE